MDALLRILLCFMFLATPHQCLAGAWLQPESQGYASLNGTYYRSDQFWDERGQSRTQPTFSKFELNPYAEYGISDETTIGANLFVQQLTQGRRDNWALSDSEFFTRHHLFDYENATFSLQPLIKLPSLHARDMLPKGGSDSFDAELAALAGYGFECLGKHHYADASIAYRYRFDDALGDQLKARVALGISITDSIQFLPAINYTHSLASPTTSAFNESGQTNYHLLKAEAALAYTLPTGHIIQLGFFSHLHGRNAGAGEGLILGIAQRF